MFTSDIAIFLLGLIAAIFGGYFGAAIGGNFAFTLTGFMILFSWGIFAVGGSDIGFNYVAFGPVMGPHITFAAGVAGAAYAMPAATSAVTRSKLKYTSSMHIRKSVG